MLRVQSETGRSVGALLKEVDRQISQALRGGRPLKGGGVTKSGEED